jgi:ABC-2 type transport system permease protein
MTHAAAEPLMSPEGGGGLTAVLRERYLLTLLVRKELRVRYRGSVLGLFWSYVKPAVQFVVFYFAVGVFLGLSKSIDDFAVYLFSGVVIINFFSEALGNATRSIVANAPLVKKIWLPRELFPVASLVVALVHLLPQVIVLLVGAVIVGWRPSVGEIALGVGAVVLTAALALALALLLGAINVFYRDFENIVDLLLMVATWLSPVLYPWTAVRDAFGDGPLLFIYLSNPLTVAVNAFHLAVWYPATTQPVELPPLLLPGLVGVGITLALLVAGQITFSRLQRRFAQEL